MRESWQVSGGSAGGVGGGGRRHRGHVPPNSIIPLYPRDVACYSFFNDLNVLLCIQVQSDLIGH